MGKHVIYDRAPRRKRGSTLWWATRRLTALTLTLSALGAVLWFAPRLRAPPPQAEPYATTADVSAPPAPSPPQEEAIQPELVAAPPAPARRTTPIPLRHPAPPQDPADDLDILSATELAAISQARADDGASQFAGANVAATTPGDATDARLREISDGQNQGGESRRRTRRR